MKTNDSCDPVRSREGGFRSKTVQPKGEQPTEKPTTGGRLRPQISGKRPGACSSPLFEKFHANESHLRLCTRTSESQKCAPTPAEITTAAAHRVPSCCSIIHCLWSRSRICLRITSPPQSVFRLFRLTKNEKMKLLDSNIFQQE